MSDPVAAASPAKGKGQKKKSTTKKVASAHPTYIEMIVAAITTLKDRKGSSRQAIEKYIAKNYNVNENHKTHVKQALRKGSVSGVLRQTKGNGASGSVKIAEKKVTPKVKKVKVNKTKKAAVKKTKTKPKSATTKKPAKKAAAAKKTPKKTAKKPAAKKPVAKKPAAKKVVKKKAKKAVKKVKK